MMNMQLELTRNMDLHLLYYSNYGYLHMNRYFYNTANHSPSRIGTQSRRVHMYWRGKIVTAHVEYTTLVVI